MKSLLLTIILIILANTALAYNIQGTVTYVYDGDTIKLREGLTYHRIRLASIDAPEKDQPYGLEATLLLKRLVLNKTIGVDVIDRDKYNREIGRITTPKSVCCTMLANGLAWHLSYFDRNNPEYAEHAKLQRMAKAMRIGLWKQDRPVEPWRWRKK